MSAQNTKDWIDFQLHWGTPAGQLLAQMLVFTPVQKIAYVLDAYARHKALDNLARAEFEEGVYDKVPDPSC